MTWECAPERAMEQYPEAQPVRFRFVENPAYEEVIFGRGLCDQLRRSSKPLVRVDFEVSGNSRCGLVGYRETTIDGKEVVNAGGMGSSGATHPAGPHPLSTVFTR
jgi:hypothetical protein